MKKWMTGMNVLAVAGLALFGAQAAHADVIIDAFDDVPSYAVTHGNTDSRSGVNTISGERTLKVERTAGSGDVEGKVGGGEFSYSADSGTKGKALLTWDPLGDIDLTESGVNLGIQLTGFLEAGQLKMEIFSASGSSSAVFGVGNDGDSYTTVFMPFTSFTGSADFTAANKLTLLFNTTQFSNKDGAVLGDLRATNVPEPGTMTLLGLGGAGLVAKLRRRRRQEA